MGQDEVNMGESKKKALQEQIQQLQEEKTQLAFILEAHKSVCSRVSSESALDVKPITSEPRVLVKAEPEIHHSTVRHLTHAEAMEADNQQVMVTTTVRLAAHQKTETSLQPPRWQRFKQPQQPQHSHRDSDEHSDPDHGEHDDPLQLFGLPPDPHSVDPLLREPAKDQLWSECPCDAGAWKPQYGSSSGLSMMGRS